MRAAPVHSDSAEPPALVQPRSSALDSSSMARLARVRDEEKSHDEPHLTTSMLSLESESESTLIQRSLREPDRT